MHARGGGWWGGKRGLALAMLPRIHTRQKRKTKQGSRAAARRQSREVRNDGFRLSDMIDDESKFFDFLDIRLKNSDKQPPFAPSPAPRVSSTVSYLQQLPALLRLPKIWFSFEAPCLLFSLARAPKPNGQTPLPVSVKQPWQG